MNFIEIENQLINSATSFILTGELRTGAHGYNNTPFTDFGSWKARAEIIDNQWHFKVIMRSGFTGRLFQSLEDAYNDSAIEKKIYIDEIQSRISK